MKSRYRIKKNERIQEIRRKGRSVSDRSMVVCALPNGLPYSRFGFSVSNRIGNAVRRNRIKRRLREATRLRMGTIQPGWDIVFIARKAIAESSYQQIDAACARLLRRAQLLQRSSDEREFAQNSEPTSAYGAADVAPRSSSRSAPSTDGSTQ